MFETLVIAGIIVGVGALILSRLRGPGKGGERTCGRCAKNCPVSRAAKGCVKNGPVK